MRSRVHWYYDTLTPGLRSFPRRANLAVDEKLKEFAQDVEDYMRENAPWEDRTGDAREGLTAEAESHGFHHTIWLYHTVDYGIWLEVRWSGQYAIIVPTIEAMGPKAMASLHEII